LGDADVGGHGAKTKVVNCPLVLLRLLFTEDFLEQLGLRCPVDGGEGTDLVWDSFHLRSSVWPEKLGVHVYSLVKDDMGKMLYGDTRELYDEAYASIAVKLANNPALLEVSDSDVHRAKSSQVFMHIVGLSRHESLSQAVRQAIGRVIGQAVR
jgi:hypothetical protein